MPQSCFDVFATAATDGVVALWDVRADRCAARFSAHVNRREALGLAFSPCMRRLAVGSEDKLAYVFDLRTGTPLARLKGHTDVVSAVVFNPRHPQLITASYDGRLRFYTQQAA